MDHKDEMLKVELRRGQWDSVRLLIELKRDTYQRRIEQYKKAKMDTTFYRNLHRQMSTLLTDLDTQLSMREYERVLYSLFWGKEVI